MGNLNDIQTKLQQLQEMGRNGDANTYQFILQLLYADVDAYNRRHSKTLLFKYCKNPGNKIYASYSTFPNQLSEQIDKLNK